MRTPSLKSRRCGHDGRTIIRRAARVCCDGTWHSVERVPTVPQLLDRQPVARVVAVSAARYAARTDGDVSALKELGRYVRKGEKAITLCQPVTIKRTSETVDGQAEDVEILTRFV